MLPGQPIVPLESISKGRSVLSLDRLQNRQPVLDSLKLSRSSVQTAGEVAKREGQVLELRLDLGLRFEVPGEPRVDRRQLADALPDTTQRAQRRGFRLVELAVPLATQPLDRLGVTQQLPLARELFVFPDTETRALELAELKLDEVDTRGALASVHLQPLELLAQIADAFERRGDPRTAIAQTSPAVEQRQMLRRVEKLLVLVLSVKLDERVRQRPEIAGGGQRAVDERAAAALRGDLATDDQLVTLSRFKHGLDRCEVFAGPDQVLSRPAAQQQADGANQNGLAGPCLAGEDVERLFKLDRDRLDHREVPDGEEANHAKRGTAIVSGV